MANCYGTEQHAKFRQEQLELGKNGEWIQEDEHTEQYKNYKLKYVTYSSSIKTDDSFIYNHGELSIYNNEKLVYYCDDIYEDYPTFFYFYTINDCDYLIFRKDDLYGYTILNLNSLDEHNYFPNVVLNREQESFIITEAKLWYDLLLLFGCHWGCPYIYYLLDTKTYKTHMLCKRNVDETKTVIDDTNLTIYYTDGDKPEFKTYTYDELIKIITKSDSYDI